MSTVGELIDRTWREYLYPPSETPATGLLETASLGPADVSLIYKAGILSPQEIAAIGPGSVIELGREQILVGAHNTGTRTLSGLIRAFRQPAAAADTHVADTPIYIEPRFSRAATFDAVCDAVESLSPRLYKTETEWVSVGGRVFELENPLAFAAVRYRYQMDGDWISFGDVEILTDWPDSSTLVAVQVGAPAVNTSGYLTYKASFPRPTNEADNLTVATGDWAMPQKWEQIVMLGAVIALTASVDIDAIGIEFLSKGLEGERFPVASGERIRNSLLRYRDFLMQEAVSALNSVHETPVRYLPTVLS